MGPLLAAVMLSTSIQSRSAMPEVPYTVAKQMWPVELGHHRAIVRVDSAADIAKAVIPWRRRDRDPEKKAIIVTELASGARVPRVARLSIDRYVGEIAFGPVKPGNYAVYYLPYKPQPGWGGYYGDYTPPTTTDNGGWLPAPPSSPWPEAKVVEFQARTTFDSFYPMEVVSTPQEVDTLLEKHREPYLVFPEDRKRPIAMPDDLPLTSVMKGPANGFRGEAQRNEYFAFQVGVWAARQKLDHVRLTFSDLRGPGVIPAKALTCFSQEGIDTDGQPFTRRVDVEQGRVQAMWCGVDVPRDAKPGQYVGVVTVQPENAPPTQIRLTLNVLPKVLEDRGDSELWRFSRLRWLNSTAGADDTVVPPYTPLVLKGGRTVACLGRTVTFDEIGLPTSIKSAGQEVLAGPVEFAYFGPGTLDRGAKSTQVIKGSGGSIAFESTRTDKAINLQARTEMEFDGHVNVKLTLKAKQAVDLTDIRLKLPICRESATYFMGIGRPGGFTPKSYEWKWTGPYDSFWIGSVSAGIHCEFRGATYNGPMLNIYHPKPPTSWGNEGKGLVSLRRGDSVTEVVASSGRRSMRAGEQVTYEFALLITPVKKLDPATHFKERYYHNPADPWPTAQAFKAGVNVVNVHHANRINPYINFPFLSVPTMKAFVDKGHRAGAKVKIYYTVRELTNHVAEIHALRSLGHEVLAGGGGGGFPWLREHLGGDYTPQWYTLIEGIPPDAAILTSGESRWYNYYVEGLGWLVKNIGIDGLYLDDVTYDRRILKRMRRVMQRAKPGCVIDLHSNTGFSIGPANQYTEFFPYVDRLWFGESFNYEAMPPDQWLVECTGIPFGLMGDMLQGGGNRWRGMLYGMTVRLPWESDSNRADPRPVWKLWDSFGIAQAKMAGYWEPSCPVRTGRPGVLATAYVKRGKTLISVASWAPQKTTVKLRIDWKALGIDPAKARLVAPEIEDFQPAMAWKPGAQIPVSPGRGWLTVADEGPLPVAKPSNVYAGLRQAELGPWTIQASTRPGTRCERVADRLEIAATANSAAFAEVAVPTGTGILECDVAPDTDLGESWGPGIALIWQDRTLRFYARSREGRFGVDVGDRQEFGGSFTPGSTVHLRVRFGRDRLLLQASDDQVVWQTIRSFPRSEFPGTPDRARFGKTGPFGRNEDYAVAGQAGTCAIAMVRAWVGR